MRVLSYSLFRSPRPVYWRTDGTEDRLSAYARYLPTIIRAHHALWPDYEMRVHHDDAARAHPYFVALQRLHDRGLLRLIDCGPAQALTLSMIWRMRPLFDEDPHLTVTCDLDALPLLSLRYAVEDFADSGRAVMVARGCETHNSVLGGSFGAEAVAFRRLIDASSFDAFIAKAGAHGWEDYGADESFLRRNVWPRVWRDAIVFGGAAQSVIQIADHRIPAARPLPDVLPVVVDHGNHFAPYIGSAGFDVEAAFAFYDALPLGAMRSVRECEAGVDVGRVTHP